MTDRTMKIAGAAVLAISVFAFADTQAALAGSAGSASDMARMQGKWVLEAGDEPHRQPTQEPYFELNGSSIRGFDGCNTFGGSIDDPTSLRKSQRGCPSDIPAFPLNLANPLLQLKESSVAGDILQMPASDGKGVAKFVRKPSR